MLFLVIRATANSTDSRATVRIVPSVGVVMDWMQQHPDTLLIVTADHQTGGLSILDGDVESGGVKAAFATSKHSGVAVPLFAAGPGAHAFHGVIDNTELSRIVLQSLSLAAQK